MQKLKEMLSVEENGTTEDLRFTLEPVACLGACGLRTGLHGDDDTHGRLTADKLGDVIARYE
jgi:NADH-quinone oxidoreductase subunit E